MAVKKKKAKPVAKKKKATRAHPKDMGTKKVVKKKAKPEAVVPVETLGAVAQVWAIADSMKDADPHDVYAACEAKGINRFTVRKQYGYWHKKHFDGQTPGERFGRESPVNSGTIPKADDSKVPVITTAAYKAGWESYVLEVDNRFEDGFRDPDGVEYVRAKGNERADLIYKNEKGMPPYRLRKLEGSSKSRLVKKEEDLIAHGNKQKMVSRKLPATSKKGKKVKS